MIPGRVHYLEAYELSKTRADRHRVMTSFHANTAGKIVPVKEDCLHYCLPGPPDDWNALLKEVLLGAAQ